MKFMKFRDLFVLYLILVFQIKQATGQERLSEEALYYRCHAHLSQLRPALNDAILLQVKAGTKTALQACTEILDRARFTAAGGTKIANDNDEIARAVLNSFYQLHSSWSRERGLFTPNNVFEMVSNNAWFEDFPISSYMTKALFSPNIDVSTVLKGKEYLQPVRTNMSPASYSNVPNPTQAPQPTDYRLGSHIAPRGDLLGIRSLSLAPTRVFDPMSFTGSIPNFSTIGAAPDTTINISSINYPDFTSLSSPLGGISDFAIRITGKLKAPSAGRYRLFLDVNFTASLYVNNTKIRDFGTSKAYSDVNLISGDNNIEVQYRQRSIYNQAAAGVLIMSWTPPGLTEVIIPASSFTSLKAEYFTKYESLPAFQFTGNEGGGFIGNHNYFLTTFLQMDGEYKQNGADLVNRTWARAVLKDTLCREVPVVREEDVTQFVIPQSKLPFRQAAACNTCHASMDRQAGVIKGLRWNVKSRVSPTAPAPFLYGIYGVNLETPTLPALTEWSDQPDTNYYKRQPYGRLFFRNYKGELVDRVVNSIEELGQAITEQDDFYACFAKKYYHYFTGIEVELGDPGNTSYPQLNEYDRFHLSKVIELGSRLKSHRSLRQLIIDIMALDEYRLSDFGISSKGPKV